MYVCGIDKMVVKVDFRRQQKFNIL